MPSHESRCGAGSGGPGTRSHLKADPASSRVMDQRGGGRPRAVSCPSRSTTAAASRADTSMRRAMTCSWSLRWMKGRFLSFHFSTFHTGCRKVAPSVEQRRERMPSWLWTDVIVTGDSAEAVEEFVRGECDATGSCTLSAPGDLRVALGFDGFVCNDDSAFMFTYVNLKQERKPAVVAKFETRWQPPLSFFERMASRYPFLMFLMRVEHEDDESYPKGYFIVSPIESPTVQAPQSSR